MGARSNILTCVLCAIRRTGHILLLRRNNPPYTKLWGLVGGKMDFGEQIGAAAEREAKEETGLDVRFVRLAGVVNETLSSAGSVTHHFTLYVCELQAPDGPTRESPEGKLQWFGETEVVERRKEMIPTDYRMIKSLVLAEDEAPHIYEADMIEEGGSYFITRFAPVRVARHLTREP